VIVITCYHNYDYYCYSVNNNYMYNYINNISVVDTVSDYINYNFIAIKIVAIIVFNYDL